MAFANKYIIKNHDLAGGASNNNNCDEDEQNGVWGENKQQSFLFFGGTQFEQL